MNLRGINYKTSLKSCTCVPKMNVLYNVTTDLTGGCLAFVAHDCPQTFHYVIESHKCYKYINDANNWSVSRKLCNDMLNSHPVIFDEANEATAIILYMKSRSYVYSWTAGYVNYTNGLAFHWGPYPGITRPIDPNVTFWYPGAPYPFGGGTDCIEFMPRFGGCWFDYYCDVTQSVLCEYDVVF
ncbi:hypothetical protein HELRODRAFT_183217 [Helobdella robusta]|uniref:C-type lectin domain-containing protein n=1 Tax=Helobdella robusta TaxID=6412 RepID=T1FJB8_HELRO|nr:hypothetical protein HELRODRAFT_183217 [Helobdella robusta]ESO11431.1 hypothetical protein HELRODRAFT_183217 [Helobdella robusta]